MRRWMWLGIVLLGILGAIVAPPVFAAPEPKLEVELGELYFPQPNGDIWVWIVLHHRMINYDHDTSNPDGYFNSMFGIVKDGQFQYWSCYGPVAFTTLSWGWIRPAQPEPWQTLLNNARADVYGHEWSVIASFYRPETGTAEMIPSRVTSYPGDGIPVDLRLQPPEEKESRTNDPINIATGEMYINATDISLPGRGWPLELTRSYRSHTHEIHSFGWGWRSNYDACLSETDDGIVIEYDAQGVGTWYTPGDDGTYTPSAGKYAVLIKNSDGTYTITRKGGVVEEYDTNGRIVSITDRNDNTISISRSESGAITAISDEAGRTIAITTDDSGKITSAVDPAGREWTYTYTGDDLTSITDGAGTTVTYVYDANHNITELTNAHVNPSGNVASHHVNPSGNVAFGGNKTWYAYDSQDRCYMNWQTGDINKVTITFGEGTSTVTDARGHNTVYEFNDYGLATRVTDALGNSVVTEWDENMNRTSVTDKLGNTTRFQYDERGNLTKVIDALSNETSFTYTSLDLVATITDALGNVTGYSYDENGNLATITDALGNQTVFTYDDYGQPLTVTDARGNATIMEYDEAANPTRIVDALAQATLMTYDAKSDMISLTNPAGQVTQFIYDSLSRLTGVTYPDTTSTSQTYDPFGNTLSATDQKGNVSSWTYDASERVTAETNALGNAVCYTYDADGNLLTYTDENDNTTTYTYDVLGRLISESTPLGKTTSYTYDAAGNKTSVTDPNGNTTLFFYDRLNRLIHYGQPAAVGVTFMYDALGNRIAMIDSTGTTQYTYDPLSRLISVDGPLSDDTISYTYDEVGNRISMSMPGGTIITYTYDELNRLSSLNHQRIGTVNYSYDDNSNLLTVSYPNGTTAEYTYDTMDRVTSLINRHGAEVINSFNYSHDAAGMITDVSLPESQTISYTYDAINRLTGEHKTRVKINKRGISKTVTAYEHVYSYDPVGNRLTMARPQRFTKTYQYNADNELLSWTKVKGEELVKSLTYTYDNNGSRTIKHVENTGEEPFDVTYTYDPENRLTGITTPATMVLYTYDGLGRKVSATKNGQTVHYLYDGMNVVTERDEQGRILRSYLRAPGYEGGIGGIIAVEVNRYEADEPEEDTDEGSEDTEPDPGLEPEPEQILVSNKPFFYHYDAQGNVTALTNKRGKTVTRLEYNAYGQMMEKEGRAGLSKYRYSSKLFDTGLYYYGVRHYDPQVGRWLTRDPIGYVDGSNVYNLVRANPANYVDPWGCKGKFIDNFKSALDANHDFFYSKSMKVVRTTTYVLLGTSATVANSTGYYTAGEAIKEYIFYMTRYHPGLGMATAGTALSLAGSAAANTLLHTLLIGGSFEAGLIGGSAVDAAWQTYVVPDDVENKRCGLEKL